MTHLVRLEASVISLRFAPLPLLLSCGSDPRQPPASPLEDPPLEVDAEAPAVTEQNSQLRIVLHDGPTPDVDEVWVAWDEVSVHSAAAGWQVLSDIPASVDLLTLQDGVSTTLGLAALDPGAYTQIRLHVTDAWAVSDGEEREVDVPSGDASGLKIAHGFDVPECGTLTLSLDWDVGAHLHETGNGKLKLRPVLVVDDETVEGDCTPEPLESGSVDRVADLTIDGTVTGHELGYNLEAIGDVDGDGITDLFAGAFHRPAVFTELLSRENDDPALDQASGGPFMWFVHSTLPDAMIGRTVEAGNVGGGSGQDLVVGVFCTPAYTACKQVYVLFDVDDPVLWPRTDGRIGQVDLATVPWPQAMHFANDSTPSLFGMEITVHPDVDNNGYDELSMADPYRSSQRGAVWLAYGPVDQHELDADGAVSVGALVPSQSLRLFGVQSEQALGQNAAATGNFDCDAGNTADLAVGQQGKNGGPARTSAVAIVPSLWNGSSLLTGAYTLPNDIGLLGGYFGNDGFGTAVGRSMAAVPAGGGCDDLLVGAPNGGPSFAGRAYWLPTPVAMAGVQGFGVQAYTLLEGAPGAALGGDVVFAGEVTGPGSSVVVLGAVNAETVFVALAGAPMPPAAPLATLVGVVGAPAFGRAVTELGDLNGDGYDDFAASDRGFASEGRIHLFLGGPTSP